MALIQADSKGKVQARPLPKSNWDGMPEAILHIIFNRIACKDKQSCRMVSKYWQSIVNLDVKVGSRLFPLKRTPVPVLCKGSCRQACTPDVPPIHL